MTNDQDQPPVNPVSEIGQQVKADVDASKQPAQGHHEKPWGMDRASFAQFVSLVCTGLERMDRRQRWYFFKVLKPIAKQLNVRWPYGRSIEDIQREIADQASRVKLIKPTGVNPELLKEKK